MTEPQWSNAVAALTFTDAAASRAGRFIADDGNARLRLRVLVEGGGCSGFQYRFRFDDGREDGDIEIFNAGVALVVDPVSAQYLAGAEIDYEEDLSGAQFVVRNPNADSTCGCGSSFSV